MPITINAPRALTIKDQKELFLIEIVVACNGTTNTVQTIRRNHQAVTRDNSNNELRRNLERLIAEYVMADFGAGVQTGIQNFVDALDVKP
jgi:hypothetical protein